jgi:hypothetical protein
MKWRLNIMRIRQTLLATAAAISLAVGFALPADAGQRQFKNTVKGAAIGAGVGTLVGGSKGASTGLVVGAIAGAVKK